MTSNTQEILVEALRDKWTSVAIILSDPIYQLPDSLFELKQLKSLSIGRSLTYSTDNTPHMFGALRVKETFPIKEGLNFHLVDSPSDLLPLFRNIDSLEELQLALWGSNNKIVEIPKAISNFTLLEKLNISNLDIETAPPELCKLKSLKTLELNNNKLCQLPSEIGDLSNLETLDIGINLLSALPPSIERLKLLTLIDFSLNLFTVFPTSLCQLKHLNMLKAGNYHRDLTDKQVRPSNQIKLLPKAILNLSELNSLDLRGNPLGLPPELVSVIDQPSILLSYYFDHDQKPLNESKVIVIGQGSVGKTSLINRLLSDSFNPEECKTDGISISRWNPISKVKQKKSRTSKTKSVPIIDELRLNVWDFGGQEIMHATHQFFLTKRSLYLLVLDSRLTQEENRTEYWLKIVQSFGGQSPIIVVGNKIDQHPLDIDRTGLQKKYSNICAIVDVSAAKGNGMAKLRSTIMDQVKALPHIHDRLPSAWFSIKNQLESLASSKNFMIHDEFRDLCQQFGIIEDSSQRTLIGFLHDLGIVLHFQDDPRLESLGILNPLWVTNGVYKILNSHELFHNKGRLTTPLLHKILNFPEYPQEKQLFIVDMMRRFELCYEIDSTSTFLVPDLLPKDQTYTGEWSDVLAFQYHYNVLPSSIISRFIVRMSAFIHQNTLWRSGVVIVRGGNTALVSADLEDNVVAIFVKGDVPTRRDLLSMIRLEFESIHLTLAKIIVQEKVPIASAPGIIVDYQHLMTLERKGIDSFIPEGLDEPVSVKELLDGVTDPLNRLNQKKDTLPSREESQKQYSALDNTIKDEKARKIGGKINWFKSISLGIPLTTGRTILELLGRDKAHEHTQIIIGYAVILLLLSIAIGLVKFTAVIEFFIAMWRFFFPTKA